MDFRDKQVLPPKDWGTFESLCQSLFAKVWGDPLAKKNGRSGQPQAGVDVIGRFEDGYVGIQCKGKEAAYGARATKTEIIAELAKAGTFQPQLSHWILATTAPNDAKLQEFGRVLSEQRKTQGLFSVDVLGWGHILDLLAANLDVAKLFYPEHVLDIPAILERLESSAPLPRPAWLPVEFGELRDLGPALMGQKLGPADALSCPTLEESSILAAQLRTSFSARLYGAPGSGKSVCSMQAVLPWVRQGFKVRELFDPASAPVELPETDEPTVFVIDDAHLMPERALALLERQAGAKRLVLSTLNASDLKALPSHAAVLDPKRAVSTIAAALRKQRSKTLLAVRDADDQIGDRPRDHDLGHRLAEAERTAQSPWQFCFILGGGWRRTGVAADKARVAGADLVLAAVALQQQASFDARANVPSIVELCAPAGLSPDDVAEALRWLVKQRLVLSLDDCRTPHQRFSAMVLHRILLGRTHVDRTVIFDMISRVLLDERYPLSGLSRFLEEFRFPPGDQRWWRSIPQDVLLQLGKRCWAAPAGSERGEAAYTLDQMWSFKEDWLESLIRPHRALLSSWLSDPGVAGYGLARLLNNVMNQHDEALLSEIIDGSDAVGIAAAISAADEQTFFGCAELVDRIHCPSEAWKQTFLSALDQANLVAVAASAKTEKDAFLAVHAMRALSHLAPDVAVDMAEAFVPVCIRLMRADLIETYRSLDDLFQYVLRIMDPFGVRSRKYGPSARQQRIARRIFAAFTPQELAGALSRPTLRQFQAVSYFIVCLKHVDPARARATVAALDWDTLGNAIGETWADLDHDTEACLGILSTLAKGSDQPRAVIAANAARIQILAPRLALLAPETAVDHIAAGKQVSLARYDHVDWTFGPFLVAYLAAKRPDLLPRLLNAHLAGIARSLSQRHFSWYDRAALMLTQLEEHAPALLDDILRHVDVTAAEEGWASALSKGKKPAEVAAILIDRAEALDGPVADMAARLKSRFPRRSRRKREVVSLH